MVKRKTKKEFVLNARAVHGEKYVYSKTAYIDSKTKVTITCPEHGDFSQVPSSHLAGNGCNECGRKKTTEALKKSTEDFIKKARKVHGQKYDYSQVEYTNAHQKIIIICVEHGTFEQSPSKHINGKSPRGCPVCGRQKLSFKQRGTLAEFIEKASKVHNGRYDYSEVNYVTARVKVAIRCREPDHGIFYQTPDGHVGKKASGCPRCARGEVLTTEDFIRVSSEVHHEKYDYKKTAWTGAKNKVTITCPFHGDFEQQPQHHQVGIGCPSCGEEIRQLGDVIHELEKAGRDYDGFLYILELWSETEHFFKVGITRDMTRRFSRSSYMPYDYDELAVFPMGLVSAFKIEQRILDEFSSHSYEPQRDFGGRTECLSVNPLETDQELVDLLVLHS